MERCNYCLRWPTHNDYPELAICPEVRPMCPRFGPAPQELNTVGGVKVEYVEGSAGPSDVDSYAIDSTEVSTLLSSLPELR